MLVKPIKSLGTWLVLLLCLFVPKAHAHNLNIAAVKVRFEAKRTTVSVVAHAHLLQGLDAKAEIAQRLKLRINGRAFSASKVQLIRDAANGIVIWQAQQKPDADTSSSPEVALDAPLFPEQADLSTVLTVIKDRHVLDEALVNTAHPGAVIGGTGEKPTKIGVVSRFGREGVLHIFGGIDHILFLLSLLLLGGNWRQLLKIVTAFTLAHSITLSLAATGTFTLPPRIVEPVIALSIVVVALSNFRTRLIQTTEQGRDWRPYMAFGFGLIHGFGFAGALAEVGLPREALTWALVAFNGGVEVGQAALVLVFAPLMSQLVKQWPPLRLPVVRVGSLGVAAMGAFWFVQRVLAA